MHITTFITQMCILSETSVQRLYPLNYLKCQTCQLGKNYNELISSNS